VVEQDAIRILASSLGANEITETPSYYIDFSGFRDPPAEFIGSLSSKTRYHIRRTQRSYEEIGGACTLRVAQSAEEALGMLRQLAELHQARWEGRGQPGAFSSPRFTEFHEAVIRQAFDRVLMFRVQAGAEVVGALYCFLFRGWVYFYQSGFSYALDSRRNPGLLTLHLTISHCLERPELEGFDFMAGDREYKRSLTSTQRPLRWIVVRRPTTRSLLFCGLRWLKRAYVRSLKKTRRSDSAAG
jgi:CelD/BcsL family acetyltransferase involved in cellulose biosynthesis